jgi:peptide subunit release factor 1 (eRF1)
MASHVDGIDRHRARGLAMFANSADGFFAAYELPVPVTSHLVVAGRPYVGQLEDVVGEYGRFAVLLVDHERTRLFVYELGGLVEKLDERAAVPRTPEDDRGDRAKARVASQQAAQVHQHVRHAAALAFDAFSRHRFQYLAVGAPPDVAAELDAALHPYVRERLTDPVAIAVGAPPEQVKAAAVEVQERAERRRHAAVVARLRDGRTHGRSVAGLAPTLGALHARRIDCLLVSRGYGAEGWRCDGCGCLAAIGGACPTCGAAMELVADVVEEAVQEALTQSCRVHTCSDADLDVLGRIGAVLRY